MRKHLLTALALLLFASGCDSADEDPEEALFIGTWRITEIDADRTDYTEFILARYESAVIAFLEENDDFNIILDVKDTPEDVFFDGEFDVRDGELDLFSAAFGGGYDFDYTFEGDDILYLETDDDDPVLQTLFGVSLDVEQVFIVLERQD